MPCEDPPPACAPFDPYPLATTPLGRLAVLRLLPDPLMGYLLVCGRGLLSLDLPSFPTVDALSTARLGVE